MKGIKTIEFGEELVWKDAYMKRCRFLGVGRVYVLGKKG